MRISALVACCLFLCAIGLATAQTATSAGGRDLLRATAPGAFSVRYSPDRAIVSSSAATSLDLSVHLPAQPLWAYIDDVRANLNAVTWDGDALTATLALEPGTHSAEIGWAGAGDRPAPGQTIPLIVAGEPVARLPLRFSLDRIEAQGSVELPFGVARVWLDGCPQEDAPPAVVRLGDGSVSQWQRVRDRWQGRGHAVTSGEMLVSLSYPGHNLMTSPVSAIEIEPLAVATEPTKHDTMPEPGILIEAENFVAQGGGDVKVSEGEHLDQHGGKSIYTFTGDGHWLEWEFTVPEDGQYALFARVACGEPMSFREISVDGDYPAPGFRLIKFPGTGGWARSPGEWWAMQVAGGSEALPALALKAGTHRLRIKGVFQYHLNVDYFILRKL